MTQGAALVTGGAVRLGKAFALSLARAGYDIALHYNASREAAEATAEEIRGAGVECEPFPFDFSAEAEMAPLVEKVAARFPHFNLLLNSASVYQSAPLMETDRALFESQFKVNFQAPYFLTQAFAKARDRGCIVNIIDNKIAFNQFQYSAYLLSKKALAEFTKLAAVELAPNFRTNGIAPGVTLPADTRTPDYVKWRIQGIPLQRQGTPDNLCQALHYILDNEFVNGQILMVDGGESLTNVGQNAADYEQKTQVAQ